MLLDPIVCHPIHAHEVGLPVAELATRVAGAAGFLASQRGGVWLGRRRVLDPAEPVPPDLDLIVRLPPGGVYAEIQAQSAQFCYEDEWLLVVDKPQGVYVNATPWDLYSNLVVALEALLQARDGVAPRLHLAHRLDRDTSGLLLLTKHPAANAPLQIAFATRQVHKRYLGLSSGAPSWEQMLMTTGHGRSAGGRWRIYPFEAVGQSLPAGGGRIKLAQTGLQVLQRLPAAALVQAELHTGRTHQIRLHLAELGHPLVGDQRYGGPATYEATPVAGQLLHAAELGLRHPITGEALFWQSPLPAGFATVLGRR